MCLFIDMKISHRLLIVCDFIYIVETTFYTGLTSNLEAMKSKWIFHNSIGNIFTDFEYQIS